MVHIFTAGRLGLLLAVMVLPGRGEADREKINSSTCFTSDTVKEVTCVEFARLTSGVHIKLIGVEYGWPPMYSRNKVIARQRDEFVRAMLEGKEVRIECDVHSSRNRIDKNVPVYLYLKDGSSVNATIIRSGLSRVDRRGTFSRIEEYRTLEALARKKRIGIWRDPASY